MDSLVFKLASKLQQILLDEINATFNKFRFKFDKMKSGPRLFFFFNSIDRLNKKRISFANVICAFCIPFVKIIYQIQFNI